MKIFLKKGSGFVKISIICVFLCYKMIAFSFRDTNRSDHFLFFQNSWMVHYYSVICIMGDILADTAILANTSKKEPLCSCYKHTSWMGWLLKKKALSVWRICQHATIPEGQSWALDCLCHNDGFSTINWLLSFLEMDLDIMWWIHISHFWIYHL